MNAERFAAGMNAAEVWRLRHHIARQRDGVVGVWKDELDDIFGPEFTDNPKGRMIQTPPCTVMLLGQLAIVMDEGPEP